VSGRDAPRKRLYGLLRDVSTEAERLRKRLDLIKHAMDLKETETRRSETASELARAQAVFVENRRSISHLFAEVQALLGDHPDLHDQYGSEVTAAHNDWEDTKHGWPESDAEIDAAAGRVAEAQAALKSLVYHCCLVTIPPRLNQHLATLRVGQRLDFHGAFQDEIENADDRTRLLQYLRNHPGAVQGLVDASSGSVLFASTHWLRRGLSYLGLAAALVLGWLVMWTFANLKDLLGIQNWPGDPTQWPKLATAYLFVVLGALAHFGIDALKQARSASTEPSALQEGLVWLHVKELPIFTAIVTLWVATVGMAVTQAALDWRTALFVGYSVDSIVDLFLQRFAGFTSSGVEKVQAGLKAGQTGVAK